MTLPKLSDLKPEQRRVMCAEVLGWEWHRNYRMVIALSSSCKEEPYGPTGNRSLYPEDAPMSIFHSFCSEEDMEMPISPNCHETLPDPDTDANHALQLVEHLAKEWIRCEMDNAGSAGGSIYWHCQFLKGQEVVGQQTEASFGKAIVSAFLIATGKAQL